jgi:hypothetical protein
MSLQKIMQNHPYDLLKIASLEFTQIWLLTKYETALFEVLNWVKG